jgi:GT2 family glycosyltransferase
MRTAVITIVHGRHEHLLSQRRALQNSTTAPDHHVVVAIDDPAIGRSTTPELAGVHVVEVATTEAGLPLARARNAGAGTARALGADVLVFLDVDCLPAPGLVEAYAHAASDASTRGRLLCGPVTYLDPPPAGGYDLRRLDALDRPHTARPAPAPGEIELGGPHELFWSLSFALTPAVWSLIGGFDDGYAGYGGEDTDFGFRAREAGVELAWIGSARAYHQHHEVERPPVRHLDDILVNGARFRDRWGRWPMQGWLDEFARLGFVRKEGDDFMRVDDAQPMIDAWTSSRATADSSSPRSGSAPTA